MNYMTVIGAPEQVQLAAVSVPDADLTMRGHHARNLSQLLVAGLLDVVDHIPLSFEEQTSRYGRDVFGTNGIQASAARTGIRRAFAEFRDLPDDSTVRFAAGQKDAICGSCIFGRHCDEAGTVADDIDVVRGIGRMVRRLGQADEMISGKAEVEGYRGTLPYVQLSAGLARLALGNPGFRAETYPWFARPFVKATGWLRSVLS